MKDLTLVLMCAGESSRFSGANGVKKQWFYVQDEGIDVPLWLYVHDKFKKMGFSKIIVVANSAHLRLMRKMCDSEIVQGGIKRSQSVLNALNHVKTSYVCISDVARFGVDSSIMQSILRDYRDYEFSAFYKPCADAILYQDDGLKGLDKSGVFLIQTPQISQVCILKEYLDESCVDETEVFLKCSSGLKISLKRKDNSEIIYKSARARLRLILGSSALEKLTFASDLALLKNLKSPSTKIITGFGFDTHSFEKDKPMMLGGVVIPGPFGFRAHSDGDILLHALCDALLGAASLGDIGEHFSDELEENRGLDSKIMLKKVCELINSVGYEIVNVDCTLLLESPKIAPYKESIEKCIAEILKNRSVNLKATTMEGMGFIGRRQGACAMANVSLRYFDWKSFI